MIRIGWYRNAMVSRKYQNFVTKNGGWGAKFGSLHKFKI